MQKANDRKYLYWVSRANTALSSGMLWVYTRESAEGEFRLVSLTTTCLDIYLAVDDFEKDSYPLASHVIETDLTMEMGLRCLDSGVSKTSRCIGAEHRRGIRATFFGVAVLCALFGSHSQTHDGQKGPVYLCRSGATPERRHRSDIGATSE